MFPSTNRATGFGGNTSTFGSPAQANPFGNPPMFGSPATNFGTSAFGQTSTNVFGVQPAQQQNQLFSTPNTSTFGQPTHNAFGSTPLFGQQTTPASTSLFMGSTSTFGAQNRQSGYAFPAPQNSLFGQSTQPQASSVFQSSSIFGQPSGGVFGMSTAVQNGTTIKFQPVTGTDSMQKSGNTTVINTKHHSITCMKEYENKSFEELRFEDYTANRKGPQAGATPGTGGGFGAPAQPFASAANTSMFGQSNTFGTPAPAFGANTTSNTFGRPAFGTNIASTSTSGFGSFGAAAQQPQQQQQQTTSIFGAGQQAAKPFGQATPSLFGTQPTQQQTTFGSTSFFGANSSTQPSLFNKPAQPTFSAPQAGGFTFGQTAAPTPATGLFQPPKTTGFSLFNNTTTTATSAWPSTNTFGQTNAFAKPAQPTFGQPTQPVGNLFGNLGSKPTFGTTGQTSLFGTSSLQTAPSFGMQPQAQPQLGSLNTSSQLTDLRSMIANSDPYGYSPHLDNLDSFKPSSTHYVTNPKDIDNYLKETENNISNSTPKSKKIQVRSPCATEKWKMFESSYDKEDASTTPTGTTINKSIKRLSIRRDSNLKKPEPIFIVQEGRLIEKNSEEARPIITSPKALKITSPSVDQGTSTPTTVISSKNTKTPLELSKSPWMDSLTQTTNATPQTSEKNDNSTTTSPNNNNTPRNNSASSTAKGSELNAPKFVSSADIADTCGVICTRPQYYTLPPLDELAQYKNPDGTCFIKGFTIGRQGYGNVNFDEVMNVANLNIDELVHFCHKQICIYLDDATKPPIGEGLNRPARVTLDRVFPSKDARSRQGDEGDTDEAKASAEIKFDEVLQRACNRAGTTFVDYRPETGSWVFKVQHFSKYDLLDSDEADIRREVLQESRKTLDSPAVREESAPKEAEKEAPKRGLGGVAQMETNQLQMDSMATGFSSEMGLASGVDLTYFVGAAGNDMEMLGGNMGRSSLSSSLMEAELAPSRWEQDRIPKRNMQLMQMKYMFYNDDPLGRDKADKMIEEHEMDDAMPHTIDMSEIATTDISGGHMTDAMDDASYLSRPQDRDRPEIFVLRNTCKRAPIEKSLLQSRCVMDAAMFKGRSFKCGWMAGLRLFALSPKASKTCISEVLVSQASIQMANNEADPFRDHTHLDEFIDLIYKETALELEHDIMGNTIPFFQMIQTRPEERDEESLLHRLFRLSEGFSHKYQRNKHMAYYHSVWKLMVALWDTPTTSTNIEHYRREMFSQWLEHVTMPIINEILGNQSKYTTAQNVLTHLSGHNIRDAVQMAIALGYPQLSMVIAQLNSANLTRYWIQHQLNAWQTTCSMEFIDDDVQRLYMLVAGTVTNNNINILTGMDWLRCLAIYFWYICPASHNLNVVLGFYEDAFDKRRHAAKPHSKYATIQDTWDILFHLMKFYCNNQNPLEVLLSPQTHTSDPNDYRLSWLLQQVFLSMGVGLVSDECHYQTTTSFATQLEEYGQYKWTIFVLLHLKDTVVRRNLVMGVLDRQLANMDTVLEEHIVESFHIPAAWLHEVRAAKTQLLGMHWEAYRHLCYSRQYIDSHELLINELTPTLVSNHEFDILRSLLEEIEHDRLHIPRWKYQGGLILKFIRFWKIMYDFHERQEIPLQEVNAIQMELNQLLTYLRSYTAVDYRQVMIVSEMSKYCASFYTTLMKHMRAADQNAYELNNQFNLIVMPFDYKYAEMSKFIGYSRSS